ncbi:MAG: response regulator [Hyphomicrobiales bacterium]
MSIVYNIVIADDHKMFLDGLTSILEKEKQLNIIFQADSGLKALNYIKAHKSEKIDLIITDISMPEKDGIEVNRYIKEHQSHIKTLILSMHQDAKRIGQLINDNADGYILKNAEKYELLNAIFTILKGEKYYSKEVQNVYSKHLFEQKEVEQTYLTQREIDVVTLIAKEYTTQEIADNLFLSKHTIESYRKNLMIKLNVKNMVGLTKYAIKMGYLDL